MSDRVLWFVFGDVTYWSFTVDEEECLAGTLWSGADTETALQNFEAWLELFLDINKPDMIGLGMDALIETDRKATCEACHAVTQLLAKKKRIHTLTVDMETDSHSMPKSASPDSKPFGPPA